MRVAAIDVGSNSVRLLIADGNSSAPRGLGLRTVARAGEPCRLGRGLDRTGRIDPEIADLAASLAQDFSARARALGARHIVVGATAALREAENGPEVAAMIEGRVGLPVRILSGEEEARLVYHAVVTGLGGSAQRSPCIVFDIGGGSTEVVSGVGDRSGRWTSIPFGAVTLTERFFVQNPPSENEIDALKEGVRAGLMQYCASMPVETPVLAGVGGTVTVLALMDRSLISYDPALVEGWRISVPRLRDMVDRLERSTHEERRHWPAMGDGRADIVVAGALVVSMLVDRFPSSGLVCSTQGLRYGLVRLALEEIERPTGETEDPR
jgi:exopolyphosphatase/guanosine-5'-triphosphate,3'-diphosphate pyrophosphatase